MGLIDPWTLVALAMPLAVVVPCAIGVGVAAATGSKHKGAAVFGVIGFLILAVTQPVFTLALALVVGSWGGWWQVAAYGLQGACLALGNAAIIAGLVVGRVSLTREPK